MSKSLDPYNVTLVKRHSANFWMHNDTWDIHRIDGPAVIWDTGVEEYWLFGTQYESKSEYEFWAEMLK